MSSPVTSGSANIIINMMKALKNHADKETISTHHMRFEFGRILRAVKAGRPLTLTYRNKPLARIVPFKSGPEVTVDDPIFRLHELAEPMGPLSNTEIDNAIYGR